MLLTSRSLFKSYVSLFVQKPWLNNPQLINPHIRWLLFTYWYVLTHVHSYWYNLILMYFFRNSVLESRREKIAVLYDNLESSKNNSELFTQICSVRKGLKLVARILILLTPVSENKLICENVCGLNLNQNFPILLTRDLLCFQEQNVELISVILRNLNHYNKGSLIEVIFSRWHSYPQQLHCLFPLLCDFFAHWLIEAYSPGFYTKRLT